MPAAHGVLGQLCYNYSKLYYYFTDILKIKKKIWYKSIPREQPNQNTEMKIADLILLSLFMRGDDKCNISHAP